MTTFAKAKSQLGRISSDRLYKFNERLSKQALQEKSYWDVNKNTHPINRWSYLRWEKRMRDESLFADRANKLPVDQKFRFKKQVMAASNTRFMIPLGIGAYFFFCWFRYKWFGVTPGEGSVSVTQYIKFLPKAPV